MKVLADLSEINYLAVLVASIAAYGLGAVWYAPPVLGKIWQQLTGRTKEAAKGEPVALPMILAYVVTLVAVFALALFIGPNAGAGAGAAAGLVAGIGIATMSLLLNGIFEAKPVKLLAINSGYLILLFTAAGVILGAW